MKLEACDDVRNGTRVYKLEIDMAEFSRLDLCEYERALIADIGAEGTPISYKLLGLEILARRIEEANSNEITPETPRHLRLRDPLAPDHQGRGVEILPPCDDGSDVLLLEVQGPEQGLPVAPRLPAPRHT